MEFGEAVRNIRQAKGLPQSKIEELTGIKREYLSKIENGDLKNPTLDTMKKLVKGLDVSVIDLFPEEKSKLKFDELFQEQEKVKSENKQYKRMFKAIENALEIDLYEG